MTDTSPQPSAASDEVNLFTYLQVLVQWKRLLFVNMVIVGVLMAGITLLMPNTYRSTAVVIPPRQEAQLGTALSQLTKDFLPTAMVGKLGGQKSGYNYIAILASRTSMEQVVHKFGLKSVYGISSGSLSKTIEELQDHCTFEYEETGNLNINVIDTDPARAAAMANYFVDRLNAISISLGMEEARTNREYIERRYTLSRADMKAAEDSLKRFQSRYGLYSLTDQARSSIEAAAQIEAQSSMVEIEMGVLERSLGKNNPQMALKRTEVAELHRKLNEMRHGNGARADGESASMFVPFNDLPELGTQYLRLYRNFEIQNRIMQLVVPMYEQAKIDEQKNIPVVLLLDRAVPAEKKYAPQRSLIVLLGVTLVFFLSAFLVFFMESLLSRPGRVTGIEQRLLNGTRRVQRWYRIRA